MAKLYVILGGGGAFGIHCAHYLLDQPSTTCVYGIGRNSLRPEPFRLGIDQRRKYAYREFHLVHEQDMLLDYLDLVQPNVIINFAAQGEGAASWQNSWRFFDTNATALVRLYEALSRRSWAVENSRFIQIGTSELYGSVTSPAREDAPIVPSSPYAASKAAFDLYLLAMRRAGRGVPMNIIRPSNAYCPGQLLHRIIPKAMVEGVVIAKGTHRGRVPLHGGGAARKSYIHARDLASAIHLVANSSADYYDRVYNVGPDDGPISIRDLATSCAAEFDLTLDELFEVTEERVGQDGCYWLDDSAIRRDLGWSQSIPLKAGLSQVRGWAEDNISILGDWPTDYRLRA